MEAHTKLSKTERKLLKKQNKARHTLFRHEGLQISEQPSRRIVIGNGGLGNNVQQEELFEIFSPYGDMDAIVMIPKKPYSFIIFKEVASAVNACREKNGFTIERLTVAANVTLYASFVETVPEDMYEQLDLPSGLILKPDFISMEEELQLLNAVEWERSTEEQDSAAPEKLLKHRRVKHYGYEFRYGVNNVDPNSPLTQGIPEECHPVLDRVMELGVMVKRPDQLTVNQYQPGQGIPPHIDTHSPFEDGIISLSLGSQVVMDFRHPDGRHVPVFVPPRCLLIMTGEARYLWTHGITPRKSDVVPLSSSDASLDSGLTLKPRTTRTSFTFRTVRNGPCTCSYPLQCDSQKDKASDLEHRSENENSIAGHDCNLPITDQDAEKLEALHVHQVYEDIASHFSDTRHTPWPKVTDFLKSLPDGSIVADIGCGNGKYLGVNQNIAMVGCDRSVNLCQICQERGHQVFCCDILALPLRDEAFDAAICIAVVHHLSTLERRVKAVSELARVVKSPGHILISVWALEQELHKIKSNYLRESKLRLKEKERKTSSGKEMLGVLDEMVTSDSRAARSCGSHDQSDMENSGAAVVSAKQMTPNENLTNCDEKAVKPKATPEAEQKKDIPGSSERTLKIHMNGTNFDAQDLLVPWHKKANGKDYKGSNIKSPSEVFHRYYHVFQEGELGELCEMVPGVKVMDSYYDKGNWCVILKKS